MFPPVALRPPSPSCRGMAAVSTPGGKMLIVAADQRNGKQRAGQRRRHQHQRRHPRLRRRLVARWRRGVGLQDTWPFVGTIRDNIAYVRSAAASGPSSGSKLGLRAGAYRARSRRACRPNLMAKPSAVRSWGPGHPGQRADPVTDAAAIKTEAKLQRRRIHMFDYWYHLSVISCHPEWKRAPPESQAADAVPPRGVGPSRTNRHQYRLARGS